MLDEYFYEVVFASAIIIPLLLVLNILVTSRKNKR